MTGFFLTACLGAIGFFTTGFLGGVGSDAGGAGKARRVGEWYGVCSTSRMVITCAVGAMDF